MLLLQLGLVWPGLQNASAHFETRDGDIPPADAFSAFQDVHGAFLLLPYPQA